RPAVTRPVPEGRDRRWRQGRQGGYLGKTPPCLSDREEVRGHLRRRRPDRRAGHGARARPSAQPQRGNPADEGHATRTPLSRVLKSQGGPGGWGPPVKLGSIRWQQATPSSPSWATSSTIRNSGSL